MKQQEQQKLRILKISPLLVCLTILLFGSVTAQGYFCYTACQQGACVSPLVNGCTACTTNFVMSGASPSSCIFDTSQTTTKLSKQSSDFNIVPAPTGTCSNGTTSTTYNYFGDYYNNDIINISTKTAVTDPHYEVELLVWMILIDNWPSSSYVDFLLKGSTQNKSIDQTDSVVNTAVCYNANSDSYVRIRYAQPHTDTMSNVEYKVTVKITSGSGRLGVGDVFLVAKLCHSFCTACTGPTATVCSACSVGYFLSGTTCAATCLTNYGLNPPSTICIFCHTYCTSCQSSPSNCTACQNTVTVGMATKQVYKVEDQNVCDINCPTGYFPYLATKKCLSCALHCGTLTTTNQLLSSNMQLEFLYTFSENMDFSGFNYANFLSFTSDNASIVPANDLTFTYQQVDGKTFKLTLAPKANKYLVNTNICSVTKTEATASLQYTQLLNKLAPGVYSQSSCKVWSTPMVDMSISNTLSADQMSVEFLFTFTGQMDFSSFSWANFVYFTADNPMVNPNTNFTVTYTNVDSTKFKLRVVPKATVYLSSTTICAKSKAQASTSLQFSQLNYKLSPSVYGQSSCALWTTKTTDMSISNTLSADQMSVEFLFTFTEQMDFSSFNYANFVDFTADNPMINPNTNFTINYVAVDSKNFKLVVVPRATVYLSSTTICAKSKAQGSTSLQFSQLNYKLVPSVYGKSSCVLWTTQTADLSLTNSMGSDSMSVEFLFTFTAQMNFASFNYADFVFFSADNPITNPNTNFTITYTYLDDTKFKLILVPKPGVYVPSVTVCANTKAQSSTSLQFSKLNYKLVPGVYGKSSCVLWTTPTVDMWISNHMNANNASAEFLFQFSSPMDFSTFTYTDFIIFTVSNAFINSNNFTVSYVSIDDTHFRLIVTPQLYTYFYDATICMNSKAESATNLQFSKLNYKLSSTQVYGQSSCLLWTIPCVNLTVRPDVYNPTDVVQFTFAFDAEMNFNGFNFQDFLTLQIDHSILKLNVDFSTTYTQIDSSSFKLTIRTIDQMTKFSNLNICAITKSRTNSIFQTSSNGTELTSSVFNLSTCQKWSTPEAHYTVFKEEEKKYHVDLQKFNNHLEDITTQKGTQEIIKSGVFNLFMPGAQLSTTVLLHNPRISENLYEGSRFWGSFVFFNVPPYEQNSDKTKYSFSTPDQEIIQNSKARRLQTPAKVNNFVNEWKFDRTGHTGYFIFDTYIQLMLIGIVWALLCSGWIYEKVKGKNEKTSKYITRIMAVFHKVHEISLFYLLLSALIQYRNTDNSNLHLFSTVVSSIILFYYLLYELKIFYDMAAYPAVKMGTIEYQYYIRNYSIFIAYCRFEQYNDKQRWGLRHFLRPYNYHSMAFVKKALMLSAIPIFYDQGTIPVLILTILQGMDLIRFLLTIPYHKSWRNVFYFFIESLLFIFFVCAFVNQVASQGMYNRYGLVISFKNATVYKNSGLLGMIVLFAYNILFILSSIIEVGIILCTKSSFENMTWTNRNLYYKELYDHFEQYGSYYRLVKNYTEELQYNQDRKSSNTFKDWVNKLHGAEPIVDLSEQKLRVFKNMSERGHIYTTQFDEQEIKDTLEIRIQSFTIKDFQRVLYLSNMKKSQKTPKNGDSLLNNETRSYKVHRRPERKQTETKSLKNLKSNQEDEQEIPSFEIDYKIIPEIFKSSIDLNKKTANNIYVPRKIKNRIHSDLLNPHFQKNLARTLISYQMPGTDQITLSTVLKIFLKDHQQGQKIPYKRENMRQEIVIQKGRKIHKIQLNQLIQGFPVDWQSLENLKSTEIFQSKAPTETTAKRLEIKV